jgi:hypothetical protein
MTASFKAEDLIHDNDRSGLKMDGAFLHLDDLETSKIGRPDLDDSAITEELDDIQRSNAEFGSIQKLNLNEITKDLISENPNDKSLSLT